MSNRQLFCKAVHQICPTRHPRRGTRSWSRRGHQGEGRRVQPHECKAWRDDFSITASCLEWNHAWALILNSEFANQIASHKKLPYLSCSKYSTTLAHTPSIAFRHLRRKQVLGVWLLHEPISPSRYTDVWSDPTSRDRPIYFAWFHFRLAGGRANRCVGNVRPTILAGLVNLFHTDLSPKRYWPRSLEEGD